MRHQNEKLPEKRESYQCLSSLIGFVSLIPSSSHIYFAADDCLPTRLLDGELTLMTQQRESIRVDDDANVYSLNQTCNSIFNLPVASLHDKNKTSQENMIPLTGLWRELHILCVNLEEGR